ncbi:MAG: DUF1801 domain-containing protein [Cytophagales bacterium]|nr:DUF1801 domain-containing protein [Cytophagales bacterium]
MNIEVTNYIESSADSLQEILVELRKLIFSIVPNAKEQYKWSRPVYATDKDFCYIKTTKKNVTLGFFDFKKISTNQHLIEGTGKSMRHIKLSGVDEIAKLEIEKMIQEAIKYPGTNK